MINDVLEKYLIPYNMWSSRELYYENLINFITKFNDLFKRKFGEDIYNYLIDE